MLEVVRSNAFKRDLRRALKRGKDLRKLDSVVTALQQQQVLPQRYADHLLRGNWVGHRECHLEPDWLLIYRLQDDVLVLERTGTHTDLFD